SSRRRHTSCLSDWSSDVCSSDLFASSSYKWIAERVAFSQSDRLRLSFSACAFVYGSSTPIISAGIPPSSRANGPTKGIDPPQPKIGRARVGKEGRRGRAEREERR